MKFQKAQELAIYELSKCKARNPQEQIFLLQDAQGQLGSEERKAKKQGVGVEENATFSIQLFLARHPYCITIGYF